MNAARVLDTSVFVAQASGRSLDVERIPDQVATTVITMAEFNAGVLVATDSDT